MSDVAVIGAGYVGLTTATCLAHLGHRVTCADIDTERVAALSKGEIPILEDGLQALVDEGLSSRRLAFVVGAARAAGIAEFVFLCVPTPQAEDGSANLSFVEDVAREIAPVLRPGTVVINKSTMPVGSTAWSSASSPRVGPRSRRSGWRRTPSSCARARPCATSSSPTAWSSGATIPQSPSG